jgi:hypothetical protein
MRLILRRNSSCFTFFGSTRSTYISGYTNNHTHQLRSFMISRSLPSYSESGGIFTLNRPFVTTCDFSTCTGNCVIGISRYLKRFQLPFLRLQFPVELILRLKGRLGLPKGRAETPTVEGVQLVQRRRLSEMGLVVSTFATFMEESLDRICLMFLHRRNVVHLPFDNLSQFYVRRAGRGLLL